MIQPLPFLQTGMVFVFNLIVGTGALTLPSVFSRAGWALGSLIVLLLAFISYVTLTYIVEACSCANALLYYRRTCPTSSSANDSQTDSTGDDEEDIGGPEEDSGETQPLFHRNSNVYTLNTKFELGELASCFFRPMGRLAFYFCMCVYLYGDLCIYNAAVAKSLTDVICGTNDTQDAILLTESPAESAECLSGMGRATFYRLCLVAFACCSGSFVFFNPSKTKPIQLLTALFRWLAFLIMLVLASWRFVDGRADGTPPAGDWAQVPNLFGACIYSFMCHHSLPSLIAPIRQKVRLRFALGLDYIGIALFYLLLAMTGAFAFHHLQDLYTLNFVPEGDNWALKVLEYFLALFPVFTLGASYPLIGITLRNNLQVLLRDATSNWSPGVNKVFFPLLAVVPPLIITLNTGNISGLVRFTGSYAGAGIQYLIPVGLVYAARKKLRMLARNGDPINLFESPFRHGGWLVAVLVWTGLCVGLVTFTFVRA